MNPYLLPVVVLVAISVATYGIASYFNGFSVTGFSVNNQQNGSMANASDEKTVQSPDGAAETPACPDSCDDKDPCTSDRCGESTDYSCVHEKISGCCNLGKAYCDGRCVPVKCMVDKDCDDGNRYTEDRCASPNGCNAECEHILVRNVCGNGACEGDENYSSCLSDCGALAPKGVMQDDYQNISGSDSTSGKEGNVLRVGITTDKQAAVKGDNVTITVFVRAGTAPVGGAALNASIRYPSCYDDSNDTKCYVRYPSKTNARVQNYTDEDGLFTWTFSVTGTQYGTFNASVVAGKDGYETGYNHTLFYAGEST